MSLCVLVFSFAFCMLIAKPSHSTGRRHLSRRLKKLYNELPAFMQASRAENTARKYNYGMARWSDWASQEGISPLPADPLHIALYIVYLCQSASTVSPISTAIHSIAWGHQTRGHPDPTNHEVVRRAYQAAQRLLACPRSRKKPLSSKDVLKLYQCLSRAGDLITLQTLTLLVVGFAGMLRWDDLAGIKVDDVVIKPQYMAIFLEKRKNDQMRHGNWVLISRWNGPCCPVKLVELLIEKGRHEPNANLFGRIRKDSNGDHLTGKMSYSRARELLREALTKIGLDADDYGLHSLRSGAASAAAAKGIPDRLIRRQGGWRSETAMLSYFKESIPSLLAVSQGIAPV